MRLPQTNRISISEARCSAFQTADKWSAHRDLLDQHGTEVPSLIGIEVLVSAFATRWCHVARRSRDHRWATFSHVSTAVDELNGPVGGRKASVFGVGPGIELHAFSGPLQRRILGGFH
jgi:hypothetical protein